MKRNNSIHFSSANDSWSTPIELYRALDEEFKFNFDPCPLDLDPNKNGTQLDFLIDENLSNEKIDGLDAQWGTSTFCNPPYSQLYDWLKKGFNEWNGGDKTIVFLIPSRTDTRAWHKYAMKADEIRFCRGRLKFCNSENPAPFPSAIIIFRSKTMDSYSDLKNNEKKI